MDVIKLSSQRPRDEKMRHRHRSLDAIQELDRRLAVKMSLLCLRSSILSKVQMKQMIHLIEVRIQRTRKDWMSTMKALQTKRLARTKQ